MIIVDRLRIFICLEDVCRHYQRLRDPRRKYDPVATGGGECDINLYKYGWYRFHGAAGTKMATESPGFNKCGADFPAWLDDVHPTVTEGTVTRKVCINKGRECGVEHKVDVKNRTFFYIYKFHYSNECNFRYCGTD